MKRKFVFLTTVSFLAISSFAPQVLAAQRDYGSWNVGDGTVDGSYSPYNGDGYIDSVAGGTYSDLVEVRTYNIRYDSSAEVAINNYYTSENAYPGMDITDVYDHLSYNGYWSSNYPDDHFDTDNDDFDKTAEETEVTALDAYAVEPGVDYYFYVNFANGGSRWSGGNGYVEVTAHESYPQLGEYQTTAFDPLEQLNYYEQ